MAKGNFDAVLGVTLPHEGGWADHPRDPGGATMKGITLATFRKGLIYICDPYSPMVD